MKIHQFLREQIDEQAQEIASLSREMWENGRLHHPTKLCEILDQLRSIKHKMAKLLPEDAQR
jgi:hypothetical protein